jgi:hypothetical protein
MQCNTNLAQSLGNRISCYQTNQLLAIKYNAVEVAALEVTNYKIQFNVVSYKTRCNLVPHAARPALKLWEDAQAVEALTEVCHAVWSIYQQERDFYFARKQAQLVLQLDKSDLPVDKKLQVLAWFNAHFQPCLRDFVAGATRQLKRILQSRMPQDLQRDASELLSLCNGRGINVVTLVRYVVLNPLASK